MCTLLKMAALFLFLLFLFPSSLVCGPSHCFLLSFHYCWLHPNTAQHITSHSRGSSRSALKPQVQDGEREVIRKKQREEPVRLNETAGRERLFLVLDCNSCLVSCRVSGRNIFMLMRVRHLIFCPCSSRDNRIACDLIFFFK